MIFYRRQARKRGKELARQLRDSLIWSPGIGQPAIAKDEWQLEPGKIPMPGNDCCYLLVNDGTSSLKLGRFVIRIERNRYFPAIRLLDRLSVSYRGCDVWLPLIPRLRLKNAARLYITLRALFDRPPATNTTEGPTA